MQDIIEWWLSDKGESHTACTVQIVCNRSKNSSTLLHYKKFDRKKELKKATPSTCPNASIFSTRYSSAPLPKIIETNATFYRSTFMKVWQQTFHQIMDLIPRSLVKWAMSKPVCRTLSQTLSFLIHVITNACDVSSPNNQMLKLYEFFKNLSTSSLFQARGLATDKQTWETFRSCSLNVLKF